MLAPDVQEQIGQIGRADIVVGVPSYNHVETIGAVLEAVRLGLTKGFPEMRTVLVNSDGGSVDGTPTAVAEAEWPGLRLLVQHPSPPDERVAIPHHGIPGRTAAQRILLEVARRLEARACALLIPDCRSTTAEWVDRLLRPVLDDGYDCVVPVYHRHRYEGTLTSGLIYPLSRAAYGKRIRQPLASQAGLSGRLIADLCARQIEQADAVRQGLDLWMTTTAVTEGFRVCEAWLGPCVVAAHGRAADLATTFAQAVGSTFALLELTAETWTALRGSQSVPLLGEPLPLGVGPVELDAGRMVRAFRLGLKDLLPLWEQVVASDTLQEILALESASDNVFGFPHALWARVVYDFALGYHFHILHREHLVRSLVPLYLGRTAAFVRETSGRDVGATEAWIEQGCRAFERDKGYLADRWRE